MSADLETPAGFAAFLGASSNFKKLFIPATFNMSRMLKSVARQQSTTVVCDEEFYKLEVPSAKVQEYQQMCSKVNSVIIFGYNGGLSLFNHCKKKCEVDPLTLQTTYH